MSVNNKLANKIQALKAGVQPTEQEPITFEDRVLEWNRDSLDFGIVAPNSEQDYTFTYLGNKKILHAVPGCSCTSTIADGNVVKGILSIGKSFSYTKDIFVPIVKTVTITFDDGSKDVLTLTCKVDKTLNLQ